MARPNQNPHYLQAQQLEKKGQLDDAARAYAQGGAVSDAARVLMSLRRYDDAANLLMHHLGVPPNQAGRLNAEKRKEALTAAICYSRTKNYRYAVELFVALGEHPRALEVLERAGDTENARRLRDHMKNPALYEKAKGASILDPTDKSMAGSGLGKARALEQAGNLNDALEVYLQLKHFGDAGRVAERIGIHDRAAKYYIDAGLPYEASQCYIKLGEEGKALDTIRRVQSSDQRYRHAVLQAIGIAAKLGVLDFGLEQFIMDYVEAGPQSDEDFEVFYNLSQLYLRHSHLENGLETLGRIAAKNPNYKDVSKQIDSLKAKMQQSPRVYERILRDEAQFRSADKKRNPSGAPGPVENLPDLPDLPGLPPVPTPGAISQSSKRKGLPQGREHRGTFARDRPSSFDAPEPVNDVTPPPTAAAAPQPAPEAPVGDVNEMFKAGNTIANRYELEDRIGKGGMAYVFRAKDTELDELIALKVFQTPIEDDEQLLHRFKQELVLSRKLGHRNIIQLFDIGIHNGYRYISMELLSGDELKAQMGEPMELARSIDYLIQACDGLGYAHDQGIIHRDIKPQNFFVTNENVLKVMDFGIAKQGGTEGKTVAGMIAGTPNYMSPEQINGFSDVTIATDIYAMGCIAYEMFTGDVPFSHPELMPLLMMHMTKPPVPPSQHNPNIPPPLEKMILKLLEKDPANRYSTCGAFADDLRRLRGG